MLDATQTIPNEKGIIYATANLTVKGLTFRGARIADNRGGNGAGIRDQNITPNGWSIGIWLPRSSAVMWPKTASPSISSGD